jgi:hypothetical protein
MSLIDQAQQRFEELQAQAEDADGMRRRDLDALLKEVATLLYEMQTANLTAGAGPAWQVGRDHVYPQDLIDQVEALRSELYDKLLGGKSAQQEHKMNTGGDVGYTIGELIAMAARKIASLFRRTEEIEREEEEQARDDELSDADAIAARNPHPRRALSIDAAALKGALETLQDRLSEVTTTWENTIVEAERVKRDVDNLTAGIAAITENFAQGYTGDTAELMAARLAERASEWDAINGQAMELRGQVLELQEQVRVIEEQIGTKCHELGIEVKADEPDDPVALKRATDDLRRYREALDLVEQMQPLADRLASLGVDQNGHIADRLNTFRELFSDLVEKLGDAAVTQGYRDLSLANGEMRSDRRGLERKGWVDVLQAIAGFGVLLAGAAVYQAGKELLRYWAKEKYMEVFLTEEDNLRRKIRELERPISYRENLLESGERIEDWRGSDASDQLRGELENLLSQRAELEGRLAEIEAARRELEQVETTDDDEQPKSAAGAHHLYK